MTTVSFPITLTGTYTDGSVCSAADYRADFEKMRDAINHMHERFSTLIFTGHDITYQDTAKSYEPAWGDGQASGGAFGIGGGGVGDGRDFKVMNIMKVPSWMQGIRVRGLELCNFSRIPNQYGSAWDTERGGAAAGTPVVYTPNGTNPLKYGVAYGDLADFDPSYASWNATDIAGITLNTEAKIRGPFQSFTGPSLKSDPVFASGTGYGTEVANVVVPPGKYIAIYGQGQVQFKDDAGTTVSCEDLNWHFAVNALCDAMVPVL